VCSSDLILGDAKSKSDGIVKDAQTRSEQQIKEAQAKADALQADAERKHTEIMATINQQRGVLEGRIDQLRTFEKDYRSRLTSYLENQLSELGKSGTGAPRRVRGEGRRAREGLHQGRRPPGRVTRPTVRPVPAPAQGAGTDVYSGGLSGRHGSARDPLVTTGSCRNSRRNGCSSPRSD